MVSLRTDSGQKPSVVILPVSAGQAVAWCPGREAEPVRLRGEAIEIAVKAGERFMRGYGIYLCTVASDLQNSRPFSPVIVRPGEKREHSRASALLYGTKEVLCESCPNSAARAAIAES